MMTPRTFLPAEFWWTSGQLLIVSLVVIYALICLADVLHRHLQIHRRRHPHDTSAPESDGTELTRGPRPLAGHHV
ncbi:hypothetical protein AB0J38_40745 [Streptomyces sp. NPDC050095]|uniref:hypothetical protein n=1 Tax=unclassified Streptomyces TaxID=2593676 RepID=UPI0034249788